MPVLGPLDRRTIKKRCVACARRKIKCQGGTPCLYCVKKGQKCVAQIAASKGQVVFVDASTTPSSGRDASTITVQQIARSHIQTPRLYSSVASDKSTVFLKHFFRSFLIRNDFGGTLDLATIITQFQSSSSLYHASVAVGALDLSKKHYSCSTAESRDAGVRALTAYRTSVLGFQKDIENNSIQQSDASLWTTFFLGLFELMFDDTGEGFVKHFLHGTSRILQLRGPEAHLEGPGRSFFLTVRIFEIGRDLLYQNHTEPTFLLQEGWKNLTQRILDDGETCHPKEGLINLIIECSSLSNRVWQALQSDSNRPSASLNDKLTELAVEGLNLRVALNDWHSKFQQWSISTSTPSDNTQSILATICFHAISIFLSGIFDYHTQFHHITSPSLPEDQIQNHVDGILLTSETALNTTNLGSILCLFPLRIAGARVTSKERAEMIIAMLNEISRRTFVVAGTIISDLKDVWGCKGLSMI